MLKRKPPPPSPSSSSESEGTEMTEESGPLDLSASEPEPLDVIDPAPLQMGQEDALPVVDRGMMDLGRLVALDPTPLSAGAMNDPSSSLIIERGRESAQRLVDRLPVTPAADYGVEITLPDPETRLPRVKELPGPRVRTRWEAFAASKGIKKKKRDRMVWDEKLREWRPRWGYKRADAGVADEWAVQAKGSDVAGSDPWIEAREEKKAKVKSNEARRRRNVEEAHGLPKGALLSTAVGTPYGVQPPGPRPDLAQARKLESHKMRTAQVSTASMGKFDRRLGGEGDPRAGKRRKFDDSSLDPSIEKAKSLAVLKSVMAKETPVLDVDKAVANLRRGGAHSRDGTVKAGRRGKSVKSGKPKSKGKGERKGKGKAETRAGAKARRKRG